MEALIPQERPAIRVGAAAAAGAANITLVTIAVARVDARPPTSGVFTMDLWLSDAATGEALTAVTASGAVAAGASGSVLGTYTAKKALRVQTTAAGLFILSITDTAKTPFIVCIEVEGRTYPLLTL